jgi:CheY-like chemotaxis protein
MSTLRAAPKTTHQERRVCEPARRRLARGGRRAGDKLSWRQALSTILADLAASRSGRAPLILVVDDYGDACEMMVEYLRFCGFEAVSARTGAEAIEQAAMLRPDVVLLDLVLPDIDGLDVIARLRQVETTKGTKIVVFTAQVFNDTRSRVAATGALFIPKPCAPELVALQLAYLAADQTSDTRHQPSESSKTFYGS